ncbi:MAG: hypothetical protein KJ065_09185 [Anaerolineae bacterium]|nr:hypothetical protein [Anaerolineae bacterium]
MIDINTSSDYEVIGEVKRYVVLWHSLSTGKSGRLLLWADDCADAEMRALHELKRRYHEECRIYGRQQRSQAWTVVVNEVTV